MPEHRADLAIVGAGILGLAHAWAAAKSGKRVVVFERSPKAAGASVRNFGMIWPIGQPAGELLDLAMRSRELWRELLREAKLPSRETGSLHLTYRRDEVEVAQEFAALAPALGYDCQWLAAEEVLARSQAVVPDGLLGGLWSSTELTVDPRKILAELPAFLTERYGVEFRFATAVRAIAPPVLETADWEAGERWTADQFLVCSGEDFETLYPAHYAASGLTRCKLQMLRTAPQPQGWELGPSLAAGLTLRFYPAFEICKTLDALKTRIAHETPEMDRWRIHALVAQTWDGALTLGDSHEYGIGVDIFNKTEIDDLIIEYTRGFLRAPQMGIAERWYGVYAKHPTKTLVTMEPEPGVRIVASPGGSGMTLSMGLGEKTISEMGWA
jgi:FAD dependent oxidoreductase TIGR03364